MQEIKLENYGKKITQKGQSTCSMRLQKLLENSFIFLDGLAWPVQARDGSSDGRGRCMTARHMMGHMGPWDRVRSTSKA